MVPHALGFGPISKTRVPPFFISVKGRNGIIERLPVHLHRLHILIRFGEVVRAHRKSLVVAARTNRVKAEAGKDIPGRHLAAVVVAAEGV